MVEPASRQILAAENEVRIFETIQGLNKLSLKYFDISQMIRKYQQFQNLIAAFQQSLLNQTEHVKVLE